MSREKETAYHLRMATKCRKYSETASERMKVYYMKKAKSHLRRIHNIGLNGLGIDLQV